MENHITIHHKIYKLLWCEVPKSIVVTVTISKCAKLVWSDECANVCIYVLQLIAFSILNLTESKKKRAKHSIHFNARRQSNSKLWPFIMELMELSGRSRLYVKNCLLGHSWRWIREYTGNVSTNSTCNIIIICDGWSSCYKCMFPPRGFACMLDEQAPESHLIACVEVDCVRTRISIQSASASGGILAGPQNFKGRRKG